MKLDALWWSASRPGRFTPNRPVIQTVIHTSSAHVCCCFTCTADCTPLNVTQLCFMMDSKVGPTGGKLTQLLDMMEVQNINKLLQLTVHSSVRFTHFIPQHFQQFFCLRQTNILTSPSIPLLYVKISTKKPQNLPYFLGFVILLQIKYKWVNCFLIMIIVFICTEFKL